MFFVIDSSPSQGPFSCYSPQAADSVEAHVVNRPTVGLG